MWVMLESFRPVKLNKREAEIVIIEEGPGNKGRNCYYGPEAIESGGPVFRGCQVYADHPSHSEQEDLPERSVRDLIGRIKETWVATNPKTGKKQLRGILKINEGKDFDWAVSLIKESISADEEGFPPVAQVSIHADGDIKPRVVEGTQYNYVERIKSAVSVDVVTKGGIKNSGFVKFMESALGGRQMSMNRDARFRQIQQKLAESMTSEEANFVEEYLRENEEAEGAEDGEQPEIFEDEETGELMTPTGEADENGNPLFMTETGEVRVYAAGDVDDSVEEPGEGDPEMDFADDDEEFEQGEPEDEDDISIGELVDRFPHLASEIDAEENGAMESERDPEIVSLKLENKLLKSRMIADSKLAESEMGGVISVKELVGKSPEEMDTIIESRIRMIETVSGMVQGSTAALVEAANLREGDTAVGFVGMRILRNSLLPS